MLLKTYHPLPKFPPISLSGTECRLNCQHCNRAYLRGMAPAETPETLLATCRKLRDEGAIGVLLSGGSGRGGEILNLDRMVDAIQRVKVETGLLLNMHPGLMDRATAQALGGAIDFASLEIPSDETIRDVFGLAATASDYFATYDHLLAAGIPVVPHVAVYDGTEDRLAGQHHTGTTGPRVDRRHRLLADTRHADGGRAASLARDGGRRDRPDTRRCSLRQRSPWAVCVRGTGI